MPEPRLAEVSDEELERRIRECWPIAYRAARALAARSPHLFRRAGLAPRALARALVVELVHEARVDPAALEARVRELLSEAAARRER